MELRCVLMCPGAPRPDEQRNVDAKGDLDTLNRVKEKQPEALIKYVKIHHLLKGGTRSKSYLQR